VRIVASRLPDFRLWPVAEGFEGAGLVRSASEAGHHDQPRRHQSPHDDGTKQRRTLIVLDRYYEAPEK